MDLRTPLFFSMLLGLVLVSALPACAGTAGKAEPRRWQDMIHEAHRASVRDPMHYVDRVNANLPKDAYGLGDLKQVRELVSGEALPLKRSELAGSWRCRSLQVQNLGVFVYPYFKCRITDGPDGLRFEKISGSQRRSGLLFPDGDRRFVFLGGQTVNDDPTHPYSALMEGFDGEDPEATEMDTVGVLQKKAKGRFVMIFDATTEGYELYELVR